MDDPKPVEPANLRFLRRLVTTLTATMIVGLLVIIALLVIRFSSRGVALPDQITLPAGVSASAFTKGDGWYAVVSDANQILIFDQTSGKLRQTIDIVQGTQSAGD
jgi:hypothetical protein